MAYGAYGEKVQSAYLARSPQRSRNRRLPQRAIYILAAGALIFLFFLTHRSSSPTSLLQAGPNSYTTPTPSSASKPSKLKSLPCRDLPGAEDVVVVLKTGSTELQDKLPIHLTTTLRCYPNYILFSDYEETFQGEHIYDALESVSKNIREEHKDFELWRRLRRGGRAALLPQELSGPVSKPSGSGGKKENPGWKIDKWKFLPMVNRTLHEFPDKKWYTFVETDTVVFWQGLLNYLDALDPTKPLYMGAQVFIADVKFAHGGSGFVISRASMEAVVSMFNEHQREWENFTDGHWAGDAVLGKALLSAGTPMHEAWPIFQGNDPGDMTWGRVEKIGRQWCKPTVSYHHLSPSVVESLWEFEQDWMRKTKGHNYKFLRHKDMFEQYVLPRTTKPLRDWDNKAEEDRGPVSSLEECQKICEGDGGCIQYSLRADYRCMSTTTPNLGEWSKGVESGWMPERMKQWADRMEPCAGDNGWIT